MLRVLGQIQEDGLFVRDAIDDLTIAKGLDITCAKLVLPILACTIEPDPSQDGSQALDSSNTATS